MQLLFTLCNLLIYLSTTDCLKPFQQSECGKTKSCLRWSSCDFPNCDFGFSWKPTTYNDTNYLEIEIVGTLVEPANGYLALGFSEISKMINNGVVACHIENELVGISASYNVKYYNERINDVEPEFFVKSSANLYGVEYDSQTNILRCRFLRLMTPTTYVAKLKDLSSGSYYLLTAKSTFKNGSLRFHKNNKRLSLVEYDLSSKNWINNIITSNYLLIKCHACLMVFGWIFCATNGIIIANFYKNHWSHTCFGSKIWFQLHRLIQTLCVLCVSAGFVIIFIHVGRFSSLGSLPNSAHPIMGIVATGFMFTNLIMALFRCSPDHPSRWVFNRLHLLVGITAYVLALSTIMIGIQLPPAGPNLSNINYPWILVAIYLSLIVVLFIYGEIRRYFGEKHKLCDSMINIGTDKQTIIGVDQNYKSSYFILITSLVISFGFGIAFFAIILLN